MFASLRLLYELESVFKNSAILPVLDLESRHRPVLGSEQAGWWKSTTFFYLFLLVILVLGTKSGRPLYTLGHAGVLELHPICGEAGPRPLFWSALAISPFSSSYLAPCRLLVMKCSCSWWSIQHVCLLATWAIVSLCFFLHRFIDWTGNRGESGRIFKICFKTHRKLLPKSPHPLSQTLKVLEEAIICCASSGQDFGSVSAMRVWNMHFYGNKFAFGSSDSKTGSGHLL